MSPLRIVILAILFYLLYRLLTGGKKKSPSNYRGSLPAQDVLVEDPVCHTYIPKKQAVSVKKDGAEHFFCSNECLDKFIANKGE